jgi:very-short-patch-repair endonuclease
MAIRYRKPQMSLLRAGGYGRAIGEQSSSPVVLQRPRRVQKFAKARKKTCTNAERELYKILSELGGGVLRGKFHREWAYKNWILDFFLYEVRVGIEVDGAYHNTAKQRVRDRRKDADCTEAGIILLRVTNEEVFGDRDTLVRKLRVAYKSGLARSKGPSRKSHLENAVHTIHKTTSD